MLTAMSFGKVTALLAAALLLTGCQSEDGPFPSRELKLIVQASPGGLSDSVSRIIASLSEADLGVPIVCENKPGASGALAFSYVTRRPPDGYTIGHAPVEIAMVRSLGYADVGPEDMDLICLVQKSPPVLVVRSDSPWKSFDEFLNAARERPGELIMANSGTGSIWHFNTLLMEKYADFRVTHVPYSGSSGSLASLLGGHVDAVISGAAEAVANVQAGRLRPLIILAPDRSQLYPDVPTTHELGYPFGAPAWGGFFGPKGIPQGVKTKLQNAFRKAYDNPEWKKLCKERGMEPVFLDSEEFHEFAMAQSEFFGKEIPQLLTMER